MIDSRALLTFWQVGTRYSNTKMVLQDNYWLEKDVTVTIWPRSLLHSVKFNFTHVNSVNLKKKLRVQFYGLVFQKIHF